MSKKKKHHTFKHIDVINRLLTEVQTILKDDFPSPMNKLIRIHMTMDTAITADTNRKRNTVNNK